MRVTLPLVVRAGAALTAAFLVASCSGGSSAPPARLVPAPPATPSATPMPTSASATLAIVQNGAAALPTLDGLAATFSFGTPIASGTTMSATEYLSAPSGTASPSALRRARSVPGAVQFFFVQFSFSGSVPVSALKYESVTLTAAQPANAAYYAELDDVTVGNVPVLSRCGPATVVASEATIDNATCVKSATTTLMTGHTYLLQFYYVPAAGATPTPTASPSATPTASPSATPKPSPSPTPTATAAPTIVEESTGISSSQAQPLGITSASGTLWVGGYQYGAIVDVPTTGAPTVFPIGESDHLAGLAAGPDGNIYFADQISSAPYIGQFTSGGVDTIFETPNHATPVSIASGSDGNLWFTEELNGAAAIAAVSTTGDFSVFTPMTLPNSTTTLPLGVGITNGPDRALWFTETSAGKIGRITTAGALTEYAAGISSGAQPYGIASGPDGALWFAESGTSKIGRITTSGQVSEFTIPTPNSVPIGIVTGADNALWFTESSGNKIGRLTTAGAFSEVAIPTANSQPWGIALGPDGHIWFTERAVNKIGTVR